MWGGLHVKHMCIIPKAKREWKLKERAYRGALVGFLAWKAYKIYVRDNFTFVISRDVNFHEYIVGSSNQETRTKTPKLVDKREGLLFVTSEGDVDERNQVYMSK